MGIVVVDDGVVVVDADLDYGSGHGPELGLAGRIVVVVGCGGGDEDGGVCIHPHVGGGFGLYRLVVNVGLVLVPHH